MSASSRVSAISADNLGIWASALCVVHCIVTPVLLSVSSVFAHFIPGGDDPSHAGGWRRGVGCHCTDQGVPDAWTATDSWIDGAGAGLYFCGCVLWGLSAVAWL